MLTIRIHGHGAILVGPEHGGPDRTISLNHRAATARWAAETLAAQGAALTEAGRLRLPLLLLYAGDDPIADPRGAEDLFAAAASPDKTACRYDGYFHEIFNEVGRERVFADLAAWVDARR